MMHFPSLCVDGFFENPDEVRNFALSLEFDLPQFGHWPGKRTQPIHLVDNNYFNYFCEKLFAYYFNNSKLEWNVETYFQKIETFAKNKDDPKNKGWIHRDTNCLSGVVYLTPNANLETGTSIFRQISIDGLDRSDAKQNFYFNGFDEGDYDTKIIKNNSCFEETIKYANIYNRLVVWDGREWHGVPSYYSNEPRLTQVFFVHKLMIDGKKIV